MYSSATIQQAFLESKYFSQFVHARLYKRLLTSRTQRRDNLARVRDNLAIAQIRARYVLAACGYIQTPTVVVVRLEYCNPG